MRGCVIAAIVASGGCAEVQHVRPVATLAFLELRPDGVPARIAVDDDGFVQLHVDLAHACVARAGHVDVAGASARAEPRFVRDPRDDRYGVACDGKVAGLGVVELHTPWRTTIAGRLGDDGAAAFAVDWSVANAIFEPWVVVLARSHRVLASWTPTPREAATAQLRLDIEPGAPLVVAIAARVEADELRVTVANRGRAVADGVHLVATTRGASAEARELVVDGLAPGAEATVVAPALAVPAGVALLRVSEAGRADEVPVIACDDVRDGQTERYDHSLLERLVAGAKLGGAAFDRAATTLHACFVARRR
jgi:hypothetical protein